MHIRNEKVDILVNGNRIDSFDLTRRKPSVVYYLENDDFSAKLSAGKTPDAVNVDEKKRMALAYFNAAFETLADLAKLDNFQAETLREKVFEALQAESEDAFEDEGIVNFGAGLYCTRAAHDRLLQFIQEAGEVPFTIRDGVPITFDSGKRVSFVHGEAVISE